MFVFHKRILDLIMLGIASQSKGSLMILSQCLNLLTLYLPHPYQVPIPSWSICLQRSGSQPIQIFNLPMSISLYLLYSVIFIPANHGKLYRLFELLVLCSNLFSSFAVLSRDSQACNIIRKEACFLIQSLFLNMNNKRK